MLFDSYQRAAPRPYQDAGVRVVDIDDESIHRLGQWPWPRTDVAELTRRLTEAAPPRSPMTSSFPSPTAPRPRCSPSARGAATPARRRSPALKALPDPDAVLAQTFQQVAGRARLFPDQGRQGRPGRAQGRHGGRGERAQRALANYTNSIEPLPQLKAAAAGAGFVTLEGDADGIVRRAPLLAAEGSQLLPSLSLDALRTAQGAGSIVAKSSDASGEIGGQNGAELVAVKVGAWEVPTTAAGELWMYYTAPQPQRTIIAAWKILTGAMGDAEMKKAFEGQIVFVGAGAAGLLDLKSTPIQDHELGVNVMRRRRSR